MGKVKTAIRPVSVASAIAILLSSVCTHVESSGPPPTPISDHAFSTGVSTTWGKPEKCLLSALDKGGLGGISQNNDAQDEGSLFKCRIHPFSTLEGIPAFINIEAVVPDEQGIFGKYSLSPIVKDTVYLIVPGIVVMGGLYVAPESVSNWTEEDKENNAGDLGNKWVKNVRNGPVWDSDDPWLNYVGHPYWGSASYVYARHYGYTRLDSFYFSAFVSTCLWEYGVEAFAEEPSIQDLIVTPVCGFLLAELIIPMETRIKANGDKILGSIMLGKTVLFLVDPLGHTIRPLKYLKDRWLPQGIELTGGPLIRDVRGPGNIDNGCGIEHQYGLSINVIF